ncbi:MAG: hypothetical protein JSS66_06130 [Armatimonadetes bacterium]|nr:hypothetical protein [Armatimonadota bacterium]
MNKGTIGRLYELCAQFRLLLAELPDCAAKQMVSHAFGVLYRTLGKLDEDLVCDVCGNDIKTGDEVTYHYKQVRHAACDLSDHGRPGGC